MKMKAAVLRETGAKRPYATSQPDPDRGSRTRAPRRTANCSSRSQAAACAIRTSPSSTATAPARCRSSSAMKAPAKSSKLAPASATSKVGDPVIFQFSASCGRCVNCLGGRTQLCESHTSAPARKAT